MIDHSQLRWGKVRVVRLGAEMERLRGGVYCCSCFGDSRRLVMFFLLVLFFDEGEERGL